MEFPTRAGGLRPRRVTRTLAFACSGVLPSAQDNGVGTLMAPGFAAQYSARVCPGQRFTCALTGAGALTRGHCGGLGLQCKTLSFSTPCRFIPALSVLSASV